MILAQGEPVLGGFEPAAEPLDLGLQVLLPLARLLQFLLHDPPAVLLRIGPLELLRQRGDVPVADALLESPGQPAFEHLGQAAQLLLDGLRLAHQDLEDAVLLAVGVDEVVAVDLVTGLELAVDAAVPLLQPARVPRHVEMEEVPAVGLEVQALAGGVGGDEDAHRVLPRIGGEGTLDLLALGGRRRPVVDGDPRRWPGRSWRWLPRAAAGGSASCRRTR